MAGSTEAAALLAMALADHDGRAARLIGNRAAKAFAGIAHDSSKLQYVGVSLAG